MIGAVNQNDFRGTPAESLGCRQAAKTPTGNYNSWQMLIHSFFSFQCACHEYLFAESRA